jgi:superkiller protein 3
VTGFTLLLALLLQASLPVGQPSDPAARSQQAARAMEAGRFEEATAIYRELLQARPDEPGLLMNLGMALAMAGREGEAIAPLERAVALNPKLIPAYLFLGTSHLARGDVAKAVPPLEKVVAAQPSDIDARRTLARAYAAGGRPLDAVTQLRKVTELAPKLPAAWHALGHAYNAVAQDVLGTFENEPEDSPWRRLLVADALAADGRFNDAFALYREAQPLLPGMLAIHHAVASIYQQVGHPDWAAIERKKGAVPPAQCAKRPALCAFVAGRHREALLASLKGSDPESRYWRVRSATELALAAFKRLDGLPDSRERREIRAALARNQRRYPDAIEELNAALKFAPGDPDLLDDLGTSYYLARDYERAVATLAPLIEKRGDDARLLTIYGDALLQLQRVDEAVAPLLQAVKYGPTEPLPRLTLGRVYVQKGEFAAAIPLLEPHLGQDQDGSLHVQLARAYQGTGEHEKAAALRQRSQEIQRAAQERNDAIAQRTITPPK